jgi:hypothetical protein
VKRWQVTVYASMVDKRRELGRSLMLLMVTRSVCMVYKEQQQHEVGYWVD